MSVIVKGMKMPESCDECLTFRLSFCPTFRCYEKFPLQDELQRLPDCPLHSFPDEHGRIVDVGPLDFVAYSLSDHEGESFDDGAAFILEKLDALPAILEAEGD